MRKLVVASLIGLLSGCVDDTNEFYVQTCKDAKTVGPELRIIIKDKSVAVFSDDDSITMDYVEFDNCKIVNSKNWKCYYKISQVDIEVEILRMQNGFLFISDDQEINKNFNIFVGMPYGFSGWRYWGYKIGLGLPKLPFAMCS